MMRDNILTVTAEVVYLFVLCSSSGNQAQHQAARTFDRVMAR